MRRLLIVALLLAGCGTERPLVVDGESTAESGVPCVPPTPVATRVPEGFPQPPAGADVTETRPGQVSGRVSGGVSDVLAHFRRAIDRAGYVVTREEDEGRSAQLAFFGARGEGTATIAALSCPPGSTGFTLRLRTPAS